MNAYPIMRKGLPARDVEREMYNRQAFLDFIKGLLNMNPLERWSPQQAIQHPFITGEKFTGPYMPSIKSSRISHSMAMRSDAPPKADGKSPVSAVQARRPRANTISSSKVQNVPHQLQRLVAMQQLQGSNRFPQTEASERMRDLQQANPEQSDDMAVDAGSEKSDANAWPGSNSGNASQERLSQRIQEQNPMIRRNSKPQINSPFGSKVISQESPKPNNQDFPEATSGNYSNPNPYSSPGEGSSVDADYTRHTPQKPTGPHYSMYRHNSVQYPIQKSFSQNPIGPDIASRFPQPSSWSSHSSFDQFQFEIMPRHGETGERQGLPSRVPSTATSAEWEMFEDLDANGPYYGVSPSASVASSQRTSRRTSMMDISMDYQNQYYQQQAGGLPQEMGYHAGYGSAHAGYMGRSPQLAQQQRLSQSSINANSSGFSMYQEQDPAYQGYSATRMSSRGSFSTNHSPSNFPTEDHSQDYEDESRDQPMNMGEGFVRRESSVNSRQFSQTSLPIPVDYHQQLGANVSASSFGGSPRNSTVSQPRTGQMPRRFTGPGEFPAVDQYGQSFDQGYPVDYGQTAHGYLPYNPTLDGKRHSVSAHPQNPHDDFQQHATTRRPRRATQHDTRSAGYAPRPQDFQEYYSNPGNTHHPPHAHPTTFPNPFAHQQAFSNPERMTERYSMPESVDRYASQHLDHRRHSETQVREFTRPGQTHLKESVQPGDDEDGGDQDRN